MMLPSTDRDSPADVTDEEFNWPLPVSMQEVQWSYPPDKLRRMSKILKTGEGRDVVLQ